MGYKTTVGIVKVSATQPCAVIYSLYKHVHLGYLFEPHVVQINSKGIYTLSHQKLYSNTAKDFEKFLDENDFKLIKLMDKCSQKFIIKKYASKSTRASEFFTEKFGKELYTTVRNDIESNIAKMIPFFSRKEIFVMSKDGNPTKQKIIFKSEQATVLFHFIRENGVIRYFPTIKLNDERINFINNSASIICEKPALMLVNGMLYQFEDGMDGKKLIPFLQKPFIEVPKHTEKTYLETFVKPLLEDYRVHSLCFDVLFENFKAKPVLQIQEILNGEFQIALYFKYGDHLFPYRNLRKAYITFNENNGKYHFLKINRAFTLEESKIQTLITLGLKPLEGNGFMLVNPDQIAIPAGQQLNLFDFSKETEHQKKQFKITDWLQLNFEELRKNGFEIIREENKQLYFTSHQIQFSINEERDWFDINAIVRFGEYEVKFSDLRENLLKGIREYILPHGEIAIIPEEWFSRFRFLFEFSRNHHSLHLGKYHIGIIQHLRNSELAQVSMDRKLEQLSDFKEIEKSNLPLNFKGDLRAYQKAGYDWLCFLNRYRFGGCLADDMGLGKTIQTLIFLQKQKEEGATNASLIIMPTSLTHNWKNEAAKFTPKLKVFAYTGTSRVKDVSVFNGYDLILTSYGITRLDVDILRNYVFNYLILDESQIIKNPSSIISKVVAVLNSNHKLILSGTPIENSVNDIWSQMSFANPGLLGLQSYFKNNFVIPIEKDKDPLKMERLQLLIKPFILRRTKEQVATELPEKIEHVSYCEMSEEQKKLYEEVKSSYRNEILKTIQEKGVAGSRISLIQGLTKLRQLANHPVMIDDFYNGNSGKFEEVVRMLENVISEDHKVLLYSQFVKHLTLFRRYLDKENIRYSYLDGSTPAKDRMNIVDLFQNENDIKIFLISLKAGGLGLNLTSADYVFIVDPWWNPATERQAIDRSHRIGQKKTVFTYKFISKDSVEEKILALQKKKSLVANQLIVTEESFVKSLTADDIKNILN